MSCGFDENMQLVISGLGDDIKQQQKAFGELSGTVKILSTKVDNVRPGIEEKLSEGFKDLENLINRKLGDFGDGNKNVDTSSIEEILKIRIAEIKSIVSGVNRPVIKHNTIRFFPEQHAGRFYKIVYGGMFLMIVAIVFLRYTYSYVTAQQEINRQIELEAQKNNPVLKAWDYLYSQKNKTLHKLMDGAFIKVENQKK